MTGFDVREEQVYERIGMECGVLVWILQQHAIAQ